MFSLVFVSLQQDRRIDTTRYVSNSVSIIGSAGKNKGRSMKGVGYKESRFHISKADINYVGN